LKNIDIDIKRALYKNVYRSGNKLIIAYRSAAGVRNFININPE